MIPRFQDRQLDADDRKFIDDVEQYNWMVMNIKDEPGTAGWSYTVGLYEHYQHPEVILFGMDAKARHSILNWIGENAKKGNAFSSGQEHDWVLDKYLCWSKPVQKKWYADLLGYALWFYNENGVKDNFPCVQAIWPDKEGRYPWQPEYGFADQPLLYEDDLVAAGMMHYASDEELKKADWPFPCDAHSRTFVSRCVVEDGDPISRVYHDPDGDWQFIGPVEDPNVDGGKISCFHCIVERDPTIKTLAGMPAGNYAWRDEFGEWKWEPYERDGEESASVDPA
jgi:uncharacterized protein DUF4262